MTYLTPMKSLSVAHSLCLGAALFFSTTAYAQEQGPPAGESVFDGDYLTIGGGAAVGPSYDGSDDYVISPLPVVIGSIGGIDFQPRGPGFAADFIRDTDGAKVDFILGPVVRARFDRHNSIKDKVVRSLGKLDVAVELGAVAGVQVNRVLHDYDSLTAAVDTRWDVAGAHGGMVVFPTLTYFTPLSRGVAVSFAISAEHVDDDYADYYFTIDPAGAAASGLPTFSANGGWKNVGATIFAGIDFDGDVTNGGFALFILGGYSKMLEDAKRSPITSIRGDSDQFLGAIGLGYTF
ncbi:MAG: MipA/OmpV family protein [Parasphingorhabdus sp.]|uniref:MipA/OmpV family protein n=1 Tax=Parasphingorhabdus sp. TaxID=2709688 RepID=UPI003001732B